MNFVADIKKFYTYYHTSVEIKRKNPTECVIKVALCKRSDFVKSFFDAFVLLINNLALAIFHGFAVIPSIGCISKFKAGFRKNVREGIVHAGSIPLSLIGILSPQIINKNFLNLIAQECVQEMEPGGLSEAVSILGDMTMRQRWQAS